MSRSSSSTSISTAAYLKVVLHAAKHTSRNVIGLLVASDASDATKVTDVLPLFHTTPLGPALEVALTQAAAVVPDTATIVGVYYAPERYEPHTVNGQIALPTPQANVAIKIAEKLRENGQGLAGSRILLLDNVRLGALGAPNSEATHSGLDVFEQSKSGSWSVSGVARIVSGSSSSSSGSESAVEFAVSQLRVLLRDEKQRLLSDFDDHLDDAKADWTNAEFEKNVMPTAAARK